jgi:molybdopterin molybdotransferase
MPEASANTKAMMSVAEARAAILAGIATLPPECVDLEDALGRVLAQPVSAWRDQPPFAVSAMDGYAVCAGATPGELTLAGESAAGSGYHGFCQPSQAIRISTGAALPQGADAVVIQEEVQRDGNRIVVPAARAGQNIRPQGGDFRSGDRLLEPFRHLDGVALSLAAAAGLSRLDVVRRPRLAVLSSGNELAVPGTTPAPWQIFDSVTFGIAGLARSWGADCGRLSLEKDDPDAIAAAAGKALGEHDLLVVIGGASVGDHDHARPALTRLGMDLVVPKVAMRPGKPTWFGRAGGKPVLGLPGNPASALVCGQLFLRPIVRAMLGQAPGPELRRARLGKALAANGPREHYLRAHWTSDAEGRLWVQASGDQDSSLISVFALSNALIRLPPNTKAQTEGCVVEMLPLNLP